MPLTFAQLTNQEPRTCETTYLGETLHLKYQPGLITGERDTSITHHEWVATTILAWDLIDEDGQPYPLTVEAVRRLPDAFLSEVVKAVIVDSRLDPTTSATSGDG